MKSRSKKTALLTDNSVSPLKVSGSWLPTARIVWVVLALLSVGWFVASTLVYYLGLYGFQVGVYDHLTHSTAVVNGYSAIIFRYAPFTGMHAALNVALMTALAPLWIIIGWVIFWRRSDDWMALVAALVLVLAGSNFSPTSYVLTLVSGATSPLGMLGTGVQALGWSSLGIFLVIFPDGRCIPRWTRWALVVYLGCILSWAMPSSWSFSVVHWPPLLFAAVILGLALTLASVQLARYRSMSSAQERQQTKWVIYGLTLGVLSDMANILPLLVVPALRQPGPVHVAYSVFSEATLILFVLVPLTIGFAVLHYRLWDIDALINRTLVYGLLTACVIGFYILVVALSGVLLAALGNLFISLLATGLVAVLFHPLRERLQQAVNRLMFGERDDPYRILSRLGSRLEATLTSADVLPTIVETIAQALKLPYTAITWESGAAGSQHAVTTCYGQVAEHQELIHIPLVYRQEQVGELRLVPRGLSEGLTPADQKLLHDLARQISVAVHAVRLTADLQRSRERLVSAREEERRRLRRDLHDGLGPLLAGLTLKLETARNRLAHDPLAEPLLAELIVLTQEAVAEIRLLVYALRPPALDELGLVSALQEQVLQYNDQEHHEIHISLEMPEHVPLLPAAVEVAAFRIAQEALTNVVRHSHASRCVVRLALHEHKRQLELEIKDNGCGLGSAPRHGVGLVSMRERAEELGGTCKVAQGLVGGTEVLVRLPTVLPQLSEAPVQLSPLKGAKAS